MSTHRHRILLCPVCHALLSASTNMRESDSPPTEGDLTVCIYCGSALEFGPQLVLRKLSSEALETLDDETRAALENAISTAQCARLPNMARH